MRRDKTLSNKSVKKHFTANKQTFQQIFAMNSQQKILTAAQQAALSENVAFPKATQSYGKHSHMKHSVVKFINLCYQVLIEAVKRRVNSEQKQTTNINKASPGSQIFCHSFIHPTLYCTCLFVYCHLLCSEKKILPLRKTEGH